MEWVEKSTADVPVMFEILYSGKFKKDYRLMKKRGYDMKLLRDVVDLLKAVFRWTRNIMTISLSLISQAAVSAI